MAILDKREILDFVVNSNQSHSMDLLNMKIVSHPPQYDNWLDFQSNRNQYH